jgi:hypothetical protein
VCFFFKIFFFFFCFKILQQNKNKIDTATHIIAVCKRDACGAAPTRRFAVACALDGAPAWRAAGAGPRSGAGRRREERDREPPQRRTQRAREGPRAIVANAPPAHIERRERRRMRERGEQRRDPVAQMRVVAVVRGFFF